VEQGTAAQGVDSSRPLRRWRPGARLGPGLWRLGRGGGAVEYCGLDSGVWTLEAGVGGCCGWGGGGMGME
jgi:hypothetical protein